MKALGVFVYNFLLCLRLWVIEIHQRPVIFFTVKVVKVRIHIHSLEDLFYASESQLTPYNNPYLRMTS
jgi:hypothetical protein